MPKNKTGKHLQFYMDCMILGDMPNAGLCSCLGISHILLALFEPTDDEIIKLKEAGLSYIWWASGAKISSKKRIYKFSPLRQTIVLFMAAINNEL